MMTSRFDLRFAANVGLALSIPLLALELMFNGVNQVGMITTEYLAGVIVLFAIIWALPTAFVALLGRLTVDGGHGEVDVDNRIRQPDSARHRFWVALVVDQWPCFTGVPNCD